MDHKRKKKYKYTKSLVSLAIKEGLNQSEIAKKCRTQQSIVSAWKNGEKKASEQQIMPLIKEFGNKLFRYTSRFYYSWDKDNGHKYYKVEGEIIFSYINYIDHGRKKMKYNKIIIHEQKNNSFILIHQDRAVYPTNIHKNNDEIMIYGDHLDGLNTSDYNLFEDDNDKCLWFSKISKYTNSDDLITYIDNFSEKFLKRPEYIKLPYLIREALVQRGYKIKDDIEEFLID